MRYILLALSSALLLFTTGCETAADSSTTGCSVDTECKGDRICNNGQCVSPAGTDGTTSTAGTTGTDGTTDSSGTTGSSAADGTDGATQTAEPQDPCSQSAGKKLSSGGCLVTCTYDKLSPGQDLYGDCKPLKMVCDVYKYCSPDSFCKSQSECSDGFACTFMKFKTPTCRIECAPGANECPAGTVCKLSLKEESYNLDEAYVCSI